MFRRIWMRLLGRSNDLDFLGALLTSPEGKSIFLGETKLVSYDPGSIRRDASRIAKYAETQDYEAFAKEAFLDVLDALDKLTSSKLTDREVDFYRGALAQTINLLKVSYRAHKKIQELNETEKKTSILR